MTSNNKPYKRRTALYAFARWLFSILSPLLFPVRYHNLENIRQPEAPFILVCNHTSLLDAIVLAVPLRRYQIHFLGKTELNRSGLLKLLFRSLNMISVSRHTTDMAAIRACNEVLKNGDVLGIFPEGTRKKPEDFMDGVENGLSVIALRNEVPLVPAYIHERARLFKRTHVYFLPPIPYDDLIGQGMGKDSVDDLTGRFISVMYEARETARGELKK